MRFIEKLLGFLLNSFHSGLLILGYFNWLPKLIFHMARGLNLNIIFFDANVIWMTGSCSTIGTILVLSSVLVLRRTLLLWDWSIMVVHVLEFIYLFPVGRNIWLLFVGLCEYEVWDVMVCGFWFFWFYFWLVFKLVLEQSS